jgi:Uma2 family endonuclease
MIQARQPEPLRWSLERFDRVIAAGAFREDDHIELINGELLVMTPQGDDHVVALNLLNQLFARSVPSGFFLYIQSSFPLNEFSKPEPDMVLVAGQPRDYSAGKRRPRAELIVEVADTSLDYDRITKGSLYSSNGIQDYWILNLPERSLEVYRNPGSSGYRNTAKLGPEAFVSPLVLPDLSYRVSDMLP